MYKYFKKHKIMHFFFARKHTIQNIKDIRMPVEGNLNI